MWLSGIERESEIDSYTRQHSGYQHSRKLLMECQPASHHHQVSTAASAAHPSHVPYFPYIICLSASASPQLCRLRVSHTFGTPTSSLHGVAEGRCGETITNTASRNSGLAAGHLKQPPNHLPRLPADIDELFDPSGSNSLIGGVHVPPVVDGSVTLQTGKKGDR
jgi:hypothetical protein